MGSLTGGKTGNLAAKGIMIKAGAGIYIQ